MKIKTTISDELDILAKLYELWAFDEVDLHADDSSFLESLSERVYSADAPEKYVFSEQEKIRLKKLWRKIDGTYQ